MNNEAEAIQQFVVWLLQTLDSANSTPSGTPSGTSPNTALSTASSTPSGDWNQATSPEQIESGVQFSAEPLSSAEAAGTLNQDQPKDQNQDQSVANPQDVSMALDEELPPLTFGDIPAVQNRFHALLKQRLKTEIERNPPRFPWETEQQDYQDDYQSDYQYGYEASPEPSYSEARLPFRKTANQAAVDQSVNQSVNLSAPIWAAHLQTLNLPIPLPEAVLHTLFEQCRHLMQSSLREGRRLVEAAESLFPGERTTLEGIAGLVLTSPVRGGHDSLRSHPNIPIDYEQASRPQQMVLSLLAARQLFEAMTLPLPSNGSTVNRSWLTEVGHLTLEAQYSPDSGRAQIKVQLPVRGTIRFQQDIPEQTALESIASCTQAGELSVSLSPLNPEQPATLAIDLAGTDVPLVFAVRLLSEF